MSSKPADTLARATAGLSLLIAICAIAIPYMQQKGALKQQQEQFEELQREELSLNFSPRVKGEIRLTEHSFGQLGHVIQKAWKLTISNTGSRRVSIVKYSLSRGDSPESTYYTGIDGGVFTKGSEPVDFPVALGPGETQSYFLLVGIIVPKAVYETLKGLEEGKNIQEEEATVALAKEGLDLYGNKVAFTEFEGGAYMLSVDSENQKSQSFWCAIQTGRDNRFFVSASEYERPAK